VAAVAPRVVLPGEGSVLRAPSGAGVLVKLSSAATGGALTVFETSRDRGDARGPRAHRHTNMDETFFVVEALEVTFDGLDQHPRLHAVEGGERRVPYDYAIALADRARAVAASLGEPVRLVSRTEVLASITIGLCKVAIGSLRAPKHSPRRPSAVARRR